MNSYVIRGLESALQRIPKEKSQIWSGIMGEVLTPFFEYIG